MTDKGNETRQRLIETAVNLLKTKGYNGVGLQQIIRESHTPKGSLYFHFPGGKEELVATALQHAGEEIQSLLTQVFLYATDFQTAIQNIIFYFISELESSNYEKGCPLATTTVDTASTSNRIQDVCSKNFIKWGTIVSNYLISKGSDPEKAEKFATFLISSIEGAVILSQAHRNTKPLKILSERMPSMIELETSQKK